MSNSDCVFSGCKVSNKKCTYGFGGGIGGNTGGCKEEKHVEHVPVGQNYNHLKNNLYTFTAGLSGIGGAAAEIL